MYASTFGSQLDEENEKWNLFTKRLSIKIPFAWFGGYQFQILGQTEANITLRWRFNWKIKKIGSGPRHKTNGKNNFYFEKLGLRIKWFKTMIKCYSF
jgi:hypothetical protein